MVDLYILPYTQMVYLILLVMLMFAMVSVSMELMLMLLRFSILISWDAMVKDLLQIFISNVQPILVFVELLIALLQRILSELLLYQALFFQLFHS